MKLFTKVMAAALLSTALSTASMAAVDVNSAGVIGDADKIGVVKGKVGVVQSAGGGLEHEITFSEHLVDSLKAMPDGSRFTGNGGQVRNLMEGLKAIYADLELAATDDTKLKAKLKDAADKGAPLKGKFMLVTGDAAAKWNDKANDATLKALRAAVVDDPFIALDGTGEGKLLAALKKDARLASLKTTGSGTYDSAAAAELAYADAKAKKDAVAGKAVLDELAKMKVTTKTAGDKSLAEVLAYEEKANWTTPEVRAEKVKAASTAKPSPKDQAAIDFTAKLLSAMEGGAFNALSGLPQAAGLDFDDASAMDLDKFLGLITAAGKAYTDLVLENSALKGSGTKTPKTLSRASSHSSLSSHGGGHYPDASDTRVRDAIGVGATYDALTGTITYQNGTKVHLDPL
ncbi:MAG: hypothetical protein K2Q34_01895 [Alphaproteobacteria bacterium]|nr:hypothetical protein [Alphaproteobacteria bacterium]